MGCRYRLHRRDLPGCPDLVFPSRRKVIFVHGCFWHRHDGCRLARLPKSRLAFWRPKLEGNKARDARHLLDLAQLGWRSLVIWECELSNLDQVREVMRIFLEGDE
jgi:DNA mismatch endonuclease (patch repair protein)